MRDRGLTTGIGVQLDYSRSLPGLDITRDTVLSVLPTDIEWQQNAQNPE